MATDFPNDKVATTTPPSVLPFLVNCVDSNQRERVANIIDKLLGEAGVSMEDLVSDMASETLDDSPSFLALIVDSQASLADTAHKGAVFKSRRNGLVELETRSTTTTVTRTSTIVGMKDGSVRVIFGGTNYPADNTPQDLIYSLSGICAPENREYAVKAINTWLTNSY